MKKLFGILLVAVALLTVSCKKETDTQMLAKRLQDIIKTEQVERILYTDNAVGDPSNWVIYGDWGKSYRFDPPLVVVEGHAFNLASLKTYEVVTISTHKCMVLVF